ncbi:hypothetical protein QBZ16_000337 [Prototheca wickerhamii]|uniref:Uncharacterized protein n=1 Tax=Prototheca wickerhamii TaxID=3111 RepID=A0AAD9INA2_PROWI|nr:hypothetical protein QBZ16_000337 [Prototheca wickerhamii]
MTTLCRKRARQTIEDFVQTYLPYHGLGANHFLEWWDILVWVEGTIYGLDERNEDILAAELGVEASPAAVEEDDWLAQGIGCIKQVLRQLDLLNAEVDKELDAAHRQELLDFLRLDEWLVDIGDDLLDYEEDVLKNSFNVYRGYVRLYGDRAPLRLAEHIGGLERQHADRLALLPERLRHTFLRRRDAAAKHEDALRWVIPQPILGEAAYRREDAP